MARLLHNILVPFAVLLSLKGNIRVDIIIVSLVHSLSIHQSESCKLVESVAITGPKDVTVHEYDDAFMECVLTKLSLPSTISRRWRLSGNEYTHSTLPGRFFTNDTGLIIRPVLLDDDGLTVQCFVVLFNSSTASFVTINSTVGVVHVEARSNSGRLKQYC